MSKFGREAKATRAQRAEVERLAAEAMSVRGIAAEVFGEARFRGRVERILRPPAALEPVGLPPLADLPLEETDFSQLSWTALIRLLFERRLGSWAASGKAPPASELRNLLDVQRRLEALEAFERIQAQTTATRTGRFMALLPELA
jgi:hypothetical protein